MLFVDIRASRTNRVYKTETFGMGGRSREGQEGRKWKAVRKEEPLARCKLVDFHRRGRYL